MCTIQNIFSSQQKSSNQNLVCCLLLHVYFNHIRYKYKLHKDSVVEFDTCPVGGHNYNGKVERRICQIKGFFDNIQNKRSSVLQWEILSSVTANTINDLPIGLGNIISDHENMDLITPNWLRLGRNNDRSPAVTMEVTGNPDRILKIQKFLIHGSKPGWLLFFFRLSLNNLSPSVFNTWSSFSSDQHNYETSSSTQGNLINYFYGRNGRNKL